MPRFPAETPKEKKKRKSGEKKVERREEKKGGESTDAARGRQKQPNGNLAAKVTISKKRSISGKRRKNMTGGQEVKRNRKKAPHLRDRQLTSD